MVSRSRAHHASTIFPVADATRARCRQSGRPRQGHREALGIEPDLADRLELHQGYETGGASTGAALNRTPRLVSGIGDLIAGLCSADCARRREVSWLGRLRVLLR